MSRVDIPHIMFKHFIKSGWPQSILYTGNQIKNKFTLLEEYLKIAYNDTSFHLKKEHPDLYIFPNNTISIGEVKKNTPGSIRHCLQHFIPYAPKISKNRFIIFLNAGKMNAQAESALLKVVEEPPIDTHFIFCVSQKEIMKSAIISRCIEVPFWGALNTDVSSLPWERFWNLSAYKETELFELLESKGWISKIQDIYDTLDFNEKDIVKFDELNINTIKSTFKKETTQVHIEILKLSFLPLYYSLRDSFIEGTLPTIGPIRIPQFNKISMLHCMYQLEVFFKNLSTKYFGTRNKNLHLIHTYFLSHFLLKWGTR